MTTIAEQKTEAKTTLLYALKNCGGVTAVAQELKLTQGAVSLWIARGQVGQKHAIPLEKLCHQKGHSTVTRYKLRPDIYVD